MSSSVPTIGRAPTVPAVTIDPPASAGTESGR